MEGHGRGTFAFDTSTNAPLLAGGIYLSGMNVLPRDTVNVVGLFLLVLGLLMLQAYQRAQGPSAGAEGSKKFLSRKEAFRRYSDLAVTVATTKYRNKIQEFGYLRQG